jgi:hypothetical protein
MAPDTPPPLHERVLQLIDHRGIIGTSVRWFPSESSKPVTSRPSSYFWN